MNKLIVAAVTALFAFAAHAQAPAKPAAAPAAAPAKAAPAAAPKASPAAANDCEAKAVGKDGKPLHGAAKSTFMKKCNTDAKSAAGKGPGANPAHADCEAKAVSKDGKPLHGAAKAASIKKCEKEAAGKK